MHVMLILLLLIRTLLKLIPLEFNLKLNLKDNSTPRKKSLLVLLAKRRRNLPTLSLKLVALTKSVKKKTPISKKRLMNMLKLLLLLVKLVVSSLMVSKLPDQFLFKTEELTQRLSFLKNLPHWSKSTFNNQSRELQSSFIESHMENFSRFLWLFHPRLIKLLMVVLSKELLIFLMVFWIRLKIPLILKDSLKIRELNHIINLEDYSLFQLMLLNKLLLMLLSNWTVLLIKSLKLKHPLKTPTKDLPLSQKKEQTDGTNVKKLLVIMKLPELLVLPIEILSLKPLDSLTLN